MRLVIIIILYLLVNSTAAQIMVKDLPPRPKLTEGDTALLKITHIDSICQRTTRYGKIREQYSISGIKISIVKSFLGEADEVEEEYSLRTKKLLKVYTYQLASCHAWSGGHMFRAKVILYVENGFIVGVQHACLSG